MCPLLSPANTFSLFSLLRTVNFCSPLKAVDELIGRMFQHEEVYQKTFKIASACYFLVTLLLDIYKHNLVASKVMNY